MMLSCVSVYAQGQKAGFSGNHVPHLISKKQHILRMIMSLKHKNIIVILQPYLNHNYTNRHTFFGFQTKLKVPNKRSYLQQNQNQSQAALR